MGEGAGAARRPAAAPRALCWGWGAGQAGQEQGQQGTAQHDKGNPSPGRAAGQGNPILSILSIHIGQGTGQPGAGPGLGAGAVLGRLLGGTWACTRARVLLPCPCSPALAGGTMGAAAVPTGRDGWDWPGRAAGQGAKSFWRPGTSTADAGGH